jgi:hypothetical protein
VLRSQRGDAGEERVISYASRSNNKPKSNYSSYARECLAAVWGVRYHRVYLYIRAEVPLVRIPPASGVADDQPDADGNARTVGVDVAGVRLRSEVQKRADEHER